MTDSEHNMPFQPAILGFKKIEGGLYRKEDITAELLDVDNSDWRIMDIENPVYGFKYQGHIPNHGTGSTIINLSEKS